MSLNGGTAARPPMRAGMAALVTLGLVAAVAGFLMLGGALGLTPLYGGFLLLWYFGSVDAFDVPALPALAIGGACGTATAWLLQYAVIHHGLPGALSVLALIIVAVFISVMRWLPLVINHAYMLYLTVMAAPLVQANEHFGDVMLTVALATVYFGVIAYVGRRIIARRARAAARTT